ncbi:MAG: hypothetical protein PHN75_07800, partial [Syntrophales bacterium]|nr:hypothetical protein [Syntrophales bacterium]
MKKGHRHAANRSDKRKNDQSIHSQSILSDGPGNCQNQAGLSGPLHFLSTYRFWFVSITIALIYWAIRINLLAIPLDRDEGAFSYIGQLILEHGLPYRDVLDHKPPLLFYIYAIGQLVFPATPFGIHLFLHVYNFVTLISLSILATLYFRSSSAGLWTALSYAVFSSGPVIFGFAASSEMFMLLPITLSLLFALLYKRERRLIFSGLSGFFGALACWTKQPAFFSIMFVFAYLFFSQSWLVIRGSERARWADVVVSMLVWFASALTVSAAICLYFYEEGVFQEFIYWSFTHSYLYSQEITLTENLPVVWFILKKIWAADFLIVSAGILGGLMLLLKKDPRGVFILGFLFFSLLGTIPGYTYEHYFVQLAPAIGLAAGFCFSYLTEFIKIKIHKNLVTALLGVLIVAIPLSVSSGYYLETVPGKISRNMYGSNPFSESIPLAEYITQHTKPDDKIFILGS